VGTDGAASGVGHRRGRGAARLIEAGERDGGGARGRGKRRGAGGGPGRGPEEAIERASHWAGLVPSAACVHDLLEPA
jgi:hypothetical protein